MGRIKKSALNAKRNRWLFITCFSVFTVCLVAAAILYYNQEKNRIHHEKYNELAEIANLKTEQIVQWKKERMADGQVLINNNLIKNAIYSFFYENHDYKLTNDITEFLKSYVLNYDYSSAILFDSSMTKRISYPSEESLSESYMNRYLKEAFNNGKIIFRGLYRTRKVPRAYFDMLIPLRNAAGSDTSVFGVIVLRIDPEKTLFPLVQTWPVPSKTSETLLVEPVGDTVVLMNIFRRTSVPALDINPLSREDFYAAVTAKGYEGTYEGIDYRGEPVVSYIRKVPDTPWYMVAKVDKAEIYASLRYRAGVVIIISVLLTLLAGALAWLFLRNRSMKLIKAKMKIQNEKLVIEEQFRQLSVRYEAILDSVPNIIMEVDTNKVYTWANQAGIDFFGDDVVGKEASYYFEDENDVYGIVNPLFTGVTDKMYVESFQRRRDGAIRLLAWWCTTIHDKNGKITGILSSATDITEQYRANAVLKASEERVRTLNDELEYRVAMRTAQLEAANKELEAFSYSVSHDLRSPLRAIHSFTKILKEEYSPCLDEEGNRICEIIESSAIRMGTLIDDLLAFSRVGRTELLNTKVDMTYLAKTAFNELTTPEERERIDFSISDLHFVYGDVPALKQVWTNLISNAIKYSSKRERAVINVGSVQNDKENIYFINDNGAGFDMKYAGKLFGMFQRLHNQKDFEGNGVGLAIVKRIISRHNGRVWAESEVNKGATFYFSIPVEKAQSSGQETPG
ncbi:MAG TPA: ATP-binding protein [Bacteroidales bacterium]|nr:ATP-binding protein [Bacteroidales bacterium]